MKRVFWSSLDEAARRDLFRAPAESAAVRNAAIEIVESVRRDGSSAVFEYARRLDGFTGEDFRVPADEIAAAREAMGEADLAAIEAAINAVRQFHAPQGLVEYSQETWPGITCSRRTDPIASAGLYVPAGSAPLVSTLIMLAVPAQMAGVPSIAVTIPPGPDGKVNTTVLAAASVMGLDQVFTVGGAQAIAALAFGEAGLPRVAKIFGPGNAWVAAAKSYVSTLPGGPAIDLPAGPSEVMVIADTTADPAFVAADLLAQAEHDPLAKVSLVSVDADGKAISDDVERQLAALPRKDIAAAAMQNAECIEARSRQEAIEIAQYGAPEHLIIQTQRAGELAERITTAGAIFLGPWTPESMGDYAAGPNHTLPTGGAGRACSGVTVESFQRTTTLIEATRKGAEAIAPTVERLAQLEGLAAHKEAMAFRRRAGGA
ncbi:histidinol dehydrogenase [Hyphobacterium sp.]|uniref:histidinol dehydrogenase n=1 Tax=Hyphobacterium sp. TaxID=2004662 RepID=UPI003BADAF9A